MDKRLCKINRYKNDGVIKSSTSPGVKPQRSIKGKSFFMWDVVLSTPADCEAAIILDLIIKYYSQEKKKSLRT